MNANDTIDYLTHEVMNIAMNDRSGLTVLYKVIM